MLVITISLLSACHSCVPHLFLCSLKIHRLFHSLYHQKLILKEKMYLKPCYTFSVYEYATSVLCNREVEEHSQKSGEERNWFDARAKVFCLRMASEDLCQLYAFSGDWPVLCPWSAGKCGVIVSLCPAHGHCKWVQLEACLMLMIQ